MLTLDITLALLTIVNLLWTAENWRVRREQANEHLTALDEIVKIRNAALALFRAAERSSIDQEHKVCSVCERITARHSTDENGATICINCEKDRVNGFANGVAISG